MADKMSKSAREKSRTGKKVSAKLLGERASARALASSPARFLGLRTWKAGERLSHLVAEGLSPSAADYLAENLKVSASEFTGKYVHIPRQTLARRKESGKLNVEESDRVARFARILKFATDMMEGDQEAAINWLKTPQVLLDDKTPLEYSVTESGAAEVQQLIGRIESGTYS